MEPRVLRPRIRSSAVAAVPRSPPAPNTRYTMWRSSTTTIGSASAIFRLRPPEEEEPECQREYRPAYGVVPEVMRVGVVVTVRAVQQGLRCRLGAVAHGHPLVAQLSVVGL